MIIENSEALIEISEVGAEIKRFFLKKENIEVLNNKNSWNRTAPILFPIVGSISGGYFKHNNRVYKIPRHGFVRDEKWTIKKVKNSIVCVIKHKPDNRYPFEFELNVKYTLLHNQLTLRFKILANDEARYNIGWHPALNLVNDIKLNSLFKYENSGGLLMGMKKNKDTTLLFKDIENNKTYIYDIFHTSINIKKMFFEFHWCDFNHQAIWTKNKNEFISIEPWAKNIDRLNATPSLNNKDLLTGNNKLFIDIFWAKNENIDIVCSKLKNKLLN